MPTIEQTIAQLEAEIQAQDKREARSRAVVKEIIERGEREGRSAMTKSEREEVKVHFDNIEDAKEMRAKLREKLAIAQRVQAGEAESNADVAAAMPTAAAARFDSTARERTISLDSTTYFHRSDNGRDVAVSPYRDQFSHSGNDSRRDSDSPKWIYRDSGRPAALTRGQSFSDHPAVREHMAQVADRDYHVIGEFGSLGQMVRSLSTTGASAIIPQIWANRVIDLARNQSCILQTNAEIVPMNAKTVNVARLTADPDAAFRAEGGTITASDPSFDSVVLTARTISALVTGSLEFFQDAVNGEQVVSSALAKALALKFDEAAMFGGMLTTTADELSADLASPPYPKGLLKNLLDNASGNVLGYGANGTAITAATPWNEILDTVYQPKLYNFEPNAIIWNAKMAKKLAKTYDANYQPMSQPRDVASLHQFVSNQVPSYTRGTMADVATDVIVGDFSEMLIGQRMELEIRVLNEKYAETGSIGIVALMRVDVQLAHPYAFSVYRALEGA